MPTVWNHPPRPSRAGPRFPGARRPANHAPSENNTNRREEVSSPFVRRNRPPPNRPTCDTLRTGTQIRHRPLSGIKQWHASRQEPARKVEAFSPSPVCGVLRCNGWYPTIHPNSTPTAPASSNSTRPSGASFHQLFRSIPVGLRTDNKYRRPSHPVHRSLPIANRSLRHASDRRPPHNPLRRVADDLDGCRCQTGPAERRHETTPRPSHAPRQHPRHGELDRGRFPRRYNAITTTPREIEPPITNQTGRSWRNAGPR